MAELASYPSTGGRVAPIFSRRPRPSSPSIRSSHVACRIPAPLIVVIFSVAAASGCGAGPETAPGDTVAFDACAPLPLVLDADVSATQSDGIMAAMTLWNDRAGTRLTLGGDQDAPGLPVHFQAAAPPFHGLYEPTGQVFINTDLSGAPLAVTIAHEIGHAFGLVHIPAGQRSSVMNPNNLVIEPTSEDIDTLALRWGVCLASAGP
jgi:hypothetical protein